MRTSPTACPLPAPPPCRLWPPAQHTHPLPLPLGCCSPADRPAPAVPAGAVVARPRRPSAWLPGSAAASGRRPRSPSAPSARAATAPCAAAASAPPLLLPEQGTRVDKGQSMLRSAKITHKIQGTFFKRISSEPVVAYLIIPLPPMPRTPPSHHSN